jgi:hypothetical protein
VPFYGVLLAPTLVLAAYGGTYASPHDLFRLLATLLLSAAFLFALIGGASRRWDAASFVVAMALLAVMGPSDLFWILAIAWLFLALRSVIWRRRAWAVTQLLTRPLNVFTTAWFGVALVTAVTLSLPPDLPPTEHVATEPGPNVYVILLDGYPRHDSLMEYFDFDNRPFLDALEERGFDVAERSTSHYPGTMQTVTTMMQMRPLEELLGEEWSGSDAQYRRLWHLLNAAPVPAAFEAAGYATYAIVSSAAALDWRTADVVLDSPALTEFEEHLVDTGFLPYVLPLYVRTHSMRRAEVLDAFAHLEASAGTTPRFVFAHILSPHHPYVFAPDGSPAAPCPESLCANHIGPPNPTLADRFLGQLRFLNGRVLEALDHIIHVDPEATVIVFSDHGLRRDRADMDEWFRTLFAARGHSFPDDVTTREIFPALLGL